MGGNKWLQSNSRLCSNTLTSWVPSAVHCSQYRTVRGLEPLPADLHLYSTVTPQSSLTLRFYSDPNGIETQSLSFLRRFSVNKKYILFVSSLRKLWDTRKSKITKFTVGIAEFFVFRYSIYKLF